MNTAVQSAPICSGLEGEIIQHGATITRHLAGDIARQSTEMALELASVQTILSEAIGSLIETFQHMHECSTRDSGLDSAGQSIQRAIISLQFQDTANQRLDYVLKRLDLLTELANTQTRLAIILAQIENPAGQIEDLVELRSHVEALSDKLTQLKPQVIDDPAKQNGFASGEVELF